MNKLEISNTEEMSEDRVSMAHVRAYSEALGVPICEFFGDESDDIAKQADLVKIYKTALSLRTLVATDEGKNMVQRLIEYLHNAMPSLAPFGIDHDIKGWPTIGHRRTSDELSMREETAIPVNAFNSKIQLEYDVPRIF